MEAPIEALPAADGSGYSAPSGLPCWGRQPLPEFIAFPVSGTRTLAKVAGKMLVRPHCFPSDQNPIIEVSRK